MPRQSQLPHTASPPGPCDRERDQWLDAKTAASEATAEKKRRHSELLDAMIEAGISRLAYTDPETNKRKWLQIRSEAKLVSAKAEAQDDAGEDEKPPGVPVAKPGARGARTVRSGVATPQESASEAVDRWEQPVGVDGAP